MTTINGLMQDDYRLTVDHIRTRLQTNNGIVISVDHTIDNARVSTTAYQDVARRVHKVGHILAALGVEPGERVGTFMWNTLEHLELFIGIPSFGAVLHTVNVRLFEDQLVYVLNHADDRVIFVSSDLLPTLVSLLGKLPQIRHIVVCGGHPDSDLDAASVPSVTSYDELRAKAPDDNFDFQQSEENQAAALCYTSGTTGQPKGVLYSHRSIALHSGALLGADSFGLRNTDRVLAVVPMFHVNAWGLPFASILADSDMVLPGRDVRPASVAALIESQQVTIMGGVPTVYSDLLQYADEHGSDLSSLREGFCGGSAVSESLMRAYEQGYGVPIYQAWGMTETSPVCTVSRPPRDVTGDDLWAYRRTQGRALPWVELRVVAPDGRVLEHDGTSRGELQVRGPWIASSYFDDRSGEDRFHDGWLRTGDVATISPDGYLSIVDRAKDVIKSGGEWISSVELENQLVSHPAIQSVAVIPISDERWGERPLACVVLHQDHAASVQELRDYLQSRVARWWIPDRFVFVDEIPRTGVGKFNKVALRAAMASAESEGSSLVHE